MYKVSGLRQALGILIAVASLCVSGTTLAAPGPIVVDGSLAMKVRFGDLDLSHKHDVKVLYRRLQSAAAQVCQSVDSKFLPMHAQFKRCKAEALDKAVAHVAIPALVEYHNARTGETDSNLQLSAG